jgi:hypothetical protein
MGNSPGRAIYCSTFIFGIRDMRLFFSDGLGDLYHYVKLCSFGFLRLDGCDRLLLLQHLKAVPHAPNFDHVAKIRGILSREYNARRASANCYSHRFDFKFLLHCLTGQKLE